MYCCRVFSNSGLPSEKLATLSRQTIGERRTRIGTREGKVCAPSWDSPLSSGSGESNRAQPKLMTTFLHVQIVGELHGGRVIVAGWGKYHQRAGTVPPSAPYRGEDWGQG